MDWDEVVETLESRSLCDELDEEEYPNPPDIVYEHALALTRYLKAMNKEPPRFVSPNGDDSIMFEYQYGAATELISVDAGLNAVYLLLVDSKIVTKLLIRVVL